jgi:DNA-binding Lrp family transcriptional regulator
MIDEVRALLKSDGRLTIREMAEKAEISVGSCRAIVTQDLGMRRIAVKYVPEC